MSRNVVLRTERLILRELELADAIPMNEYESDPEAVRYVPHDVRPLAATEDRVRNSMEEATRETRRIFDLAMVTVKDGRHVGRAGFMIGKPDDRQAMLWYVLHRAVWGRGFAAEATRALLEFAFGELGLHRVWLDADARNAASIRVAEKVGMRREAHHVEDAFVKGEWTDSVVFAMLAREWRASGSG